MALRVITPPANDPVSLAEAKAHLRVTDNNSDTEISGLIKAARDYIEKHTGRILITTELMYSMDTFHPVIELPVSPLKTVTNITYRDTTGTWQTVPNTEYLVDTDSLSPRITPLPGRYWPNTDGTINCVQIKFLAGFAEEPSDVPESLRHAILLLVGHWFENREAVLVGGTQIPYDFAVSALLAPYRKPV